MRWRQSGIAGLALILSCAGCRHLQQAPTGILAEPAAASVPQVSCAVREPSDAKCITPIGHTTGNLRRTTEWEFPAHHRPRITIIQRCCAE